MSARDVARRAGSATYQRVGKDFGFANVDRILIYGALIGVGYLAYKIWKAGKRAGDAAAWAFGKAGEGVANAFEWFFPFDTGENLFYRVGFPDGSTHAIGSRDVSKDGYFTFKGVRYRMAVDKTIKSGTNKFAVKM